MSVIDEVLEHIRRGEEHMKRHSPALWLTRNDPPRRISREEFARVSADCEDCIPPEYARCYGLATPERPCYASASPADDGQHAPCWRDGVCWCLWCLVILDDRRPRGDE